MFNYNCLQKMAITSEAIALAPTVILPQKFIKLSLHKLPSVNKFHIEFLS